MPASLRRSIIVGTLLMLLHLPFAFYALMLYGQLAPAEGLLTMTWLERGLWFSLLLLPYVATTLLGLCWNPERARLGEHTGS